MHRTQYACNREVLRLKHGTATDYPNRANARIVPLRSKFFLAHQYFHHPTLYEASMVKVSLSRVTFSGI
jgi:hypothetical protein